MGIFSRIWGTRKGSSAVQPVNGNPNRNTVRNIIGNNNNTRRRRNGNRGVREENINLNLGPNAPGNNSAKKTPFERGNILNTKAPTRKVQKPLYMKNIQNVMNKIRENQKNKPKSKQDELEINLASLQEKIDNPNTSREELDKLEKLLIAYRKMLKIGLRRQRGITKKEDDKEFILTMKQVTNDLFGTFPSGIAALLVCIIALAGVSVPAAALPVTAGLFTGFVVISAVRYGQKKVAEKKYFKSRDRERALAYLYEKVEEMLQSERFIEMNTQGNPLVFRGRNTVEPNGSNNTNRTTRTNRPSGARALPSVAPPPVPSGRGSQDSDDL
jgi:hypothetical protein